MMNRCVILLGLLLSSFLLSCSVGRRLTIPSEVSIGNVRYCVDTLQERWGRAPDAPDFTCLYFRNVHDTIVGTDKARVIIWDAYDIVVPDSIEYINPECFDINPFLYEDVTLLSEMEAVTEQILHGFKDNLSPEARKRMTDNLLYFCIELLVGDNGMILESCQYVFMDSLRIDQELLNLCAKVDKAIKSAPVIYKGITWMRKYDIPYAPTRLLLMMTADGLVYANSDQTHKLFRQSKERRVLRGETIYTRPYHAL